MKRPRPHSDPRTPPEPPAPAGGAAAGFRVPGIGPDGAGTRLTLQVVPRAGRTELAGTYGDEALRLRLAAPPVDGKANRELVRFLSERLRVPAAAVSLAAGQAGRHKILRVAGLAPGEVAARLGL